MKKLKTPTKTDDKQLTAAVRTSAQQIWQAGLGAFAKAQEEDDKVFAKLVKDGTNLQKRTQKITNEESASNAAMPMTDDVGKHVASSRDRLEQVFEDCVSRSLISLGVPNQQDVQALIERVEELTEAVAALTRKKVGPAKKRAAKPIIKSTLKTKAKDAATPRKPTARIAKKSLAKSTAKKSLKRVA